MCQFVQDRRPFSRQGMLDRISPLPLANSNLAHTYLIAITSVKLAESQITLFLPHHEIYMILRNR